MSVRLRAVLGLSFGLAAIVGNTIGAGILSAPGTIATQLQSPWLYLAVWVAGGLYAFGGANAISELATMIPRSGGQYHFAKEALGPYAGFVVGWNDWISVAGSGTAVAFVLAESVAALFPGLAGREQSVAAALIVVFTALVWRRVQVAAAVQNVTTTLKALAFLALIGAAAVWALRHGIQSPGAAVAGSGVFATVAAFTIAMQGVIYSYDGWTGTIYFSEEMREPGRTIPRATFGGLLAVLALYLLLNAAFIAVVPLERLAGDPLAAGTVARTIFGDRGDTVIRIVLVVALPSFLNAVLPMAARVLFAMSRDGLAPGWTTRVNTGGTPTAALFASAVVALLFLFTGTVEAVIAVLAFVFVATYSVSFASLFVLRRREPERPRPYRARGHPWTTGAVLVLSIAFLASSIVSDPRNGLVAAMLVAASYPIYRLTR